jgi:predicted RNase H-like HicB family nuclease
MQYPVIVEQKDGVWRAVIPALSDLAAEGASRDEAVHNVQRAAEVYLSAVEVTTIEVNVPGEENLRPGSPQAVLKAAGMFVGDEEAMLQHIEEIYAERRRQREEVERELDEAEAKAHSPDADEHPA